VKSAVMRPDNGWTSSDSPGELSVLCQEDAEASCCTRDEGGPFGAALWEVASNRHKLLQF